MDWNVSLEMLPMRVRLSHPMTDDELVTFCERQEVLQVEREPDGSLDVRPIGGTCSGMISASVGCDLMQWARKDGRGRAFLNVGFRLPDGSMRGPRLAWVSNEKFVGSGSEGILGFPVLCPEFVIEILSFNYTLEALRAKMQAWIKLGCELAWMIDPDNESVEVYRANKPVETLTDAVVFEGSGPVAGLKVAARELWR